MGPSRGGVAPRRAQVLAGGGARSRNAEVCVVVVLACICLPTIFEVVFLQTFIHVHIVGALERAVPAGRFLMCRVVDHWLLLDRLGLASCLVVAQICVVRFAQVDWLRQARRLLEEETNPDMIRRPGVAPRPRRRREPRRSGRSLSLHQNALACEGRRGPRPVDV